MKRVLEGVLRFKEQVFPKQKALFADLANTQHPRVLFVTCADSRIDSNLITQTDPGELFVCRNAGNIVPPHRHPGGGMTASVEYGLAALNVRHIVVCGHSNCGAMKGALARETLASLPHVYNWLGFTESAVQIVEAKYPEADGDEKLRLVTEANVVQQMQHLRTHPQVATKLATHDVQLYGWVYDIESGEVRAYNEETDEFETIDAAYLERMKNKID